MVKIEIIISSTKLLNKQRKSVDGRPLFLMLSGTESPPSERSDGRKSEGEIYRQLSKQLLKGEGSLGNEISAPYEVPQFPIEQIEQKLHKVRSDGTKISKQTSVDAAMPSPGLEDEDDDVDLSELIPDFQRVKISGEDNTGGEVAGASSQGLIIPLFSSSGGPPDSLAPAGQSPGYQGEVHECLPPGVLQQRRQIPGRHEQRASGGDHHHQQGHHRR